MASQPIIKTLITLATVGCVTLGASDADAATGASTGALGGGVVTVGSVGTNQIDSTADFSIDAGDTLVILGTDPVSGGGNTFGHKITFADGATIQLDSDLTVNGDGTDALDILGAATIYTNTGDLTLNDRINNSGDPVNLVKTGAGTLTLEDNFNNIFSNNPAAPPNPGVDAPEFDFQEGTVVNQMHSQRSNTHFRLGDNISLNNNHITLGFAVTSRSTLEVGNNNTIDMGVGGSSSAASLLIGNNNSIQLSGGLSIFLQGVAGSASTIGNNNVINGAILALASNGTSLTVGEGNHITFGISISGNGPSILRFLPGSTANRLGFLGVDSLPGSNNGLHIEGLVEITAGGDLTLDGSYARLYSTGALTFADPAIEFRMESSSVFQIDQDYTFNNPIVLSAGGNELKPISGTTTTINANVTGAGQDLSISDIGTLVLNASLPRHLIMSSGGDLVLGSSGSIPATLPATMPSIRALISAELLPVTST
jgi:hypothetical protein